MDILILSCGTGGGHNAAGTAIMEEFISRGHHATMLDPYTLKSNRLALWISTIYIKLVQRNPNVFGIIYTLGNLYRRLPFRSPVYYLNRRMMKELYHYLKNGHFDAIVMPHLFPAEIITNLKQFGYRLPPTFFIATDYTCIPFTEETDCDYYVIPSKDLKSEYISKGIPSKKLYPLGIPVRKQFTCEMDQVFAKRSLKFDVDKRYLFVFGGSIGAGKMEEVIRILKASYTEDNTQIIAICGSNRRLYQKLKNTYGKKVILLEKTDQVATYLKACDLVISKPGGLSSTEAAVAGTALIHITPIPGCETKNMQYFKKRGMCIAVQTPRKQLVLACNKLMESKVRNKVIHNQHRFINHNATADICDLILKKCVKS